MDPCEKCGAELGSGRFCGRCGHPVAAGAWRTDTAERPRVPVPPAPVVPPPPPPAPEPSRFPLFADEVDPDPLPPTATAAVARDEVHHVDPEPPRHREGGRAAGWLPWALGFAVLVLVAATGAWLLTTGADDPVATGPAAAAEGGSSPGRDRDREPGPTPEPTTDEPTPQPEPAEAGNQARFAEVSAPPAAPPSQDNSGNVVRYLATNMVDGVPETTWRTTGDATGATITFTFDEPVTLEQVGLVNGYAKVGQDTRGPLDWYHGNRRVLAVEWTLDDGTVLAQSLDDTTVTQTLPVDGIETRTVALRLVEVSSPGTGRASRDFTAISDVTLYGTPS